MSDAHPIVSNVTSVTTQHGQEAMALPSAIASSQPPPQKIDCPAHVLADAEKYVLNMKLLDQTDGTADPAVANGVYSEIIAAILDRHCMVGILCEWVRVTYRPRAGSVPLKELIPTVLPDTIFAKDPDKESSIQDRVPGP